MVQALVDEFLQPTLNQLTPRPEWISENRVDGHIWLESSDVYWNVVNLRV